MLEEFPKPQVDGVSPSSLPTHMHARTHVPTLFHQPLCLSYLLSPIGLVRAQIYDMDV